MIYLQDIFAVDYPSASRYHAAQQQLQDWDLSTNKDNTAAALGVCSISEEWKAEQGRTGTTASAA